MSAYYDNFQGIVLYIRQYRETDLLIKIFTREYGKTMFFAKNAQLQNHVLRGAAIPFVRATFIGRLNQRGLSFLNEAKDVLVPTSCITDIEANAYAAYMASLVDASMQDWEKNDKIFDLLWDGIGSIELGKDPATVCAIFELQILPIFGVAPNFKECSICGESKVVLDFSFKYNGMLCAKHFDEDTRRLHWSPKVANLVQLFSQINYNRLGETNLSNHLKGELRSAIDQIYDEYVGIHLKSKSFIDQLNADFKKAKGRSSNSK